MKWNEAAQARGRAPPDYPFEYDLLTAPVSGARAFNQCASIGSVGGNSQQVGHQFPSIEVSTPPPLPDRPSDIGLSGSSTAELGSLRRAALIKIE